MNLIPACNRGHLLEKWFPNGINTQFSYNDDGSLKQIRNRRGYSDTNLVSQHDYTYDGFGNRITHTENINGSKINWAYAYDDLMRVVGVNQLNATGVPIPAQAETDSYDLLNNRTSRVVGSQSTYYQYDATNQLIASHSGTATGPLSAAFVYDPNGSLTQQCQGGSVTATATSCNGPSITNTVYDPLNRITQVTQTGQPAQTYAYDDQDRRVQRTNAGGLPVDYLYQGQDVLMEYANGWTAATGFITHGAAIDIPLIWQPAASDTTGPRYFHQDGLNSVIATSTITGVNATQRYDAWGNRTAGSGQIPMYGYTGREQDGLGYTYYRARYYDPSVGRFTQRDPIELGGGINLYAYVGGNPVNGIDPFGLDIMIITGGVRDDSLNIFGHVGSAVQGYGMASYGNDTPLGSSVSSYLTSQSAVRAQQVTIIPTTEQQDALARTFINQHPANNDVGLLDNCAVRTNQLLNATGVATNGVPFPGGLARDVQSIPGAKTYFIPQNGQIPQELLNGF
ncbi:MAG: RHS repeat-associated core domain-containing protein [Thiobacillaceae bacterium]